MDCDGEMPRKYRVNIIQISLLTRRYLRYVHLNNGIFLKTIDRLQNDISSFARQYLRDYVLLNAAFKYISNYFLLEVNRLEFGILLITEEEKTLSNMYQIIRIIGADFLYRKKECSASKPHLNMDQSRHWTVQHSVGG